ncbi:hypothetical protein KOW79_012494 [Hemibagrus wyckioides]|uniref:Uncharacterized protein n=1 Tax=Hemibagrus wyckioides TaxID=337641 RepID=A0A9D3NNL2_9TELE|nr:hypothetical protein KOW79_012494 [Hemibagrus wyckioides]
MSARLPLGKEPETEGKIFCRPGGVASPRFGWPPAKRTGRSQEVEWTKSGRRIQRRRNGTERSGAEKGARVFKYLYYKTIPNRYRQDPKASSDIHFRSESRKAS